MTALNVLKIVQAPNSPCIVKQKTLLGKLVKIIIYFYSSPPRINSISDTTSNHSNSVKHGFLS